MHGEKGRVQVLVDVTMLTHEHFIPCLSNTLKFRSLELELAELSGVKSSELVLCMWPLGVCGLSSTRVGRLESLDDRQLGAGRHSVVHRVSALCAIFIP